VACVLAVLTQLVVLLFTFNKFTSSSQKSTSLAVSLQSPSYRPHLASRALRMLYQDVMDMRLRYSVWKVSPFQTSQTISAARKSSSALLPALSPSPNPSDPR
jgi:hypothetical protein